MESSYKGNIQFTIFGQSHAEHIGVTIDGLPIGFAPNLTALEAFLKRRAPGQSEGSTTRKEPDIPEFIEGLTDGRVSGSVTAIIRNRDVRSGDYDSLKLTPRPGHADYTAYVKYGADFDMAGGGYFSGRMTAPLCIVGGLCLQILAQKGIEITSKIVEIGGKTGDGMAQSILDAKAEGDSVGGIVECIASGVPAGLGGAMFSGMESRIASLVFGIPAVKGIEFGAGFRSARLRGSENNDPFRVENGKIVTVTNNCGGLLGGITDGMPLLFRAAVKPTPSIAKEQETVRLDTMENTVISVCGRHDPCIVPRVLPVMEAAMAIAVYDAMLEEQKSESLADFRDEIDRIDTKLLRLFEQRMAVSEKIAAYKLSHSLPVLDAAREAQKLNSIAQKLPEDIREDGKQLYGKIFELSRNKQSRLMAKSLRCGLLGRKLGHSYSPQIHAELGGYEYRLYEKEPEDLESFLKSGSFDGLNVTIPYKKAVIPHCGELSEIAESIGSVNTIVKRKDGTLYGDNTDAFGFEALVRKSGIVVKGRKALVLGSGGASVTVCAVLKSLGAQSVTVISRRGEDNYENLERNADAEIIVNTTPVGMYPHNGERLIDLAMFYRCCGVLDVVYNPAKTALLLQAEALGIPYAGGLYMLVAQAKRSCEAFTGLTLPDSEIGRIEKILRTQMQNIVLIGMPGSGKSSVAALLGEALGRQVIDTDAEIEKRADMRIPEIFSRFGEEYFRRLETEVIADTGKQSGIILSTGGGTVTRTENYPHLHQNGTIIWIQRDIEKLARNGRPLSETSDLHAMYEQRRSQYEAFADMTADNNGTLTDTVQQIREALS